MDTGLLNFNLLVAFLSLKDSINKFVIFIVKWSLFGKNSDVAILIEKEYFMAVAKEQIFFC